MRIKQYLFFICFPLALLLAPLMAAAQAVHGWEGTITIPTYKLGPADPNAAFPLATSRDVYPYQMVDDLTNDRISKSYAAIYLENQYLKLTILPELGGHVYSVYDKVDHREVLYRDNVVKYGLVGAVGAWIPGGMEFSFPFAHTMDSVSPVESTLRQNADGSATAVIGAIDWVSNMHWEIALTLRPDSARVEEHVTLFNSTPKQHLYLFWTNTAVKATDDLQYVYPMRETIDDNPFAIVQKWPEWKGVDQSWYKNDANAMAIFARDVHRNFFGVYYHQSDYGVVHVADYRQEPGKKLWSWGTAPSGKIWDHILSDNDGSYNEIQSGRFYTQGYRELMDPRRVETWTEYWYPVRGLKTGFVEASSQMAINVSYLDGNGGQPQVKLMVSPVSDVSNATLVVKQGATVLQTLHALHFQPLQPNTYTIPVQGLEEAKKTLDVQILSANGSPLLHWSAAEPIDGNSDFTPRAGTRAAEDTPDTPQTPLQALYLKGVFQQKRGDVEGSLKIFEEVLQRDPDYTPALMKLAWHHYEAGDFSQADPLLARARQRDEDNPALEYESGVIYRAEGRLSLAENAFWTSIHYGDSLAPAFVELGEIAIREGNYDAAVGLLKRAVSYNPSDAFALTDLAVAERLAGDAHAAAQTSAHALEQMPLLPYALAEASQDQHALEAAAAGHSAANEDWAKVISNDPQNYLAVASWYHSIGAWQSSDAVLQAAETRLPASELSPVMDYYLASNARHEGNSQQADTNAQKAAAEADGSVFPNRLEDVAVLTDAIQHNPAAANAQYALGNFLFAHGRYDEAADLWRQALNEGFKSPQLLRNLGLYEWRVKSDLTKAADDYVQAIKLSPEQYRFYLDLDEIYEQLGNNAARTALFQNAPPDTLNKDTVRARRALLLMEQSHDDEALAILTNHRFKPWEGGKDIHQIFLFANMEKGKQALADHHPEQAEEAFRRAMEYPDNLGTGAPSQPDTAEQSYWLGKALQAEGKHSDAIAAWKNATAQESNATSVSAVYVALSYKELGQNETAQKILDQCAQSAVRPNAGSESYFVAGIAERYSNHPDLAQADFKHTLQLDPRFWPARLELEQK